MCLKNFSTISSILIAYNMALLMNDAYIMYHHMDSSLSVGLVQSYFSHPDYLALQCWVHTDVLFPD